MPDKHQLLDASDCATVHDWGHAVDQVCRVVGGSSAHNGCLVAWGTPADYDEWASATGDPAWGWTAMEPRLRRAEATIATRSFADHEIGGWTRRALAGWSSLGSRPLEAFNAPAAIAGHGLLPVNRRGRLRVGAAFAYLDPARGRPNLAILADALADRVLVEGGAARGVVVRHDGREGLVAAPLVVVAAGAYGSPPLLLRTGIGPADELRALGIDVVADVPAVGRGLHDHPCVSVAFAMDAAFAAELAEDDARGALTHVQSKLKAASSRCPAGTFDLHLLPNVGWQRDETGTRTGTHEVSLIPVLLKPRARGTVRLRSADPEVLPEIDRNLFADPGVALARALATSGPVAPALAGETAPGPGVDGPALEAWIREAAFALYHPTGTCRIGRADDPDAVADADGRVRGVTGLHVGDASALPTVPRANTHLSVLAFADAMAERLAARSA